MSNGLNSLERLTQRNLGQIEKREEKQALDAQKQQLQKILPEIGKKVAAGDSVGAFEIASQVPGFTQTPAGQQLFNSLFPEQAPKPGTRVIKSIDSQGRPVEKIVEDVAGQTFVSPPEGVSTDQQTLDLKLAQVETDLFNDFRDKEVKKELDGLNAAMQLGNLINSTKDRAALNLSIKKMLNLVGEERISDQDFNQANVEQGLIEKINSWAQKTATGESIVSSRAEVAEIAEALRKASAAMVTRKAASFSKRNKRILNQLNRTPEQVAEELNAAFNLTTPIVLKELAEPGANAITITGGPDRIQVKNTQTGQIGSIPADQVEAAVKSGKFERVQ